METFLHLNNTNSNWKEGDEIFIGKGYNNFWRTYLERDESFNIQGEELNAFKVLNAAFEEYSKIHPPPKKMDSYHFQPIDTLRESIECLRNAITINRELIFESVRKDIYPHLPSRQKCIWLIPEVQESLRFWMSVLNRGERKRLFRLELLEGKFHRAAQEWLVGGTYSINKWNQLAKNYWEGERSGNIEDEVLYEGMIRIVEEVVMR
ncbi:MAG: DUF2441 domain-containing protein [Ekhidna sp.]